MTWMSALTSITYRKNWAEVCDEQIVRQKESSTCAANQGVLVEDPFTDRAT